MRVAFYRCPNTLVIPRVSSIKSLLLIRPLRFVIIDRSTTVTMAWDILEDKFVFQERHCSARNPLKMLQFEESQKDNIYLSTSTM